MPNATATPVARAGVRFEELDGEAVVYDRGGKRAIYLNETATVIWKLCDGERSVDDIATLLAREYPEAARNIAADIADTVDRLVAGRVLTFVKPR
jgi:hypothetical protein